MTWKKSGRRPVRIQAIEEHASLRQRRAIQAALDLDVANAEKKLKGTEADVVSFILTERAIYLFQK